jgi:hypothetical protein
VHQWLTIVILAIWEAEIEKIAVQGQPRQNRWKIPSPESNQSKTDWSILPVPHLLSKSRAQSSNSSATMVGKIKHKRKGKTDTFYLPFLSWL